MKLTAIILLSASLTISAKAFTQITLSKKNVPLTAVFKEIQKQSGYDFFYSYDLVQNVSRVTVNIKNATISQALEACLKGTNLTYVIVGKTIAIKAKLESPKDAATNEQPSLPATVDISGKITNAEGDPLDGASVKVKGTERGTTTNSDGVFFLKGVDENATLEISFVGYQTITVPVNNRTSISASLKLNVIAAPEVIVRKGYYNEKRATTTGNVSSVSAKDIEKQPVNNIMLTLQGRVPGLQISQFSGIPGAGVRVQIRGPNRMAANGNDPLFIVDGVPYPNKTLNGRDPGIGIGNGNPFTLINPADIESIDILKDADATAIYGSRGANGVILIATKKPKPGKPKLDFNLQSGFSKITRTMKLLNTEQYLEMRREAFKNDGATPDPNQDYDLKLWDTTRYTDWQKVFFGRTAQFHAARISYSGGNANSLFLIRSGYQRESSVFPGNNYNQKLSVHTAASNTSSNQKFRIDLTTSYLFDHNNLPSNNFIRIGVKLPPNAPALYNPDGSLNWAPDASGVSSWPTGGNPLADLERTFNLKSTNLLSNINLTYTVIKDLQAKLVLAYNRLQTSQFYAVPLTANDPAFRDRVERYATFGNNTQQSWSIEPQLSYTVPLFGGNIAAVIGEAIQQNNALGQNLTAFGFNSDAQMQDISAAARIISGGTTNSQYKYNGIFSRLNYNYADRYILNLTARKDGSSRFGPENRFHNFASAAVAWVFSKEKLISKNIGFLNHGKIRISYGTSGNDGIGDYGYLDTYSNISSVGVLYQGAIGILPFNLNTPDLQWEETRKLELGLDLNFLNDRIVFQTSVYQFRSSNQLLAIPLPSVTGFVSINKNQDALLQNRGIEVELRTINVQRKNFQWVTNFNISSNRNKILYAPESAPQFIRDRVGHSFQSQFYYHFAGLDPISGKYQFYNSGGSLTDAPDPVTDMKLFNPETRFYGGIQNTFTYKGLELDLLFQFSKNPHDLSYLFDYIPGVFSKNQLIGNQPVGVLNRWQKPGDVRPYQPFSQNISQSKTWEYINSSNLFWSDASYIRLKNLSLSWRFPKLWEEKIQLTNTRVFMQAQNLLTLTRYKGTDPETTGSDSQLPPLKVITFGIHLTF